MSIVRGLYIAFFRGVVGFSLVFIDFIQEIYNFTLCHFWIFWI